MRTPSCSNPNEQPTVRHSKGKFPAAEFHFSGALASRVFSCHGLNNNVLAVRKQDRGSCSASHGAPFWAPTAPFVQAGWVQAGLVSGSQTNSQRPQNNLDPNIITNLDDGRGLWKINL
jgi:hypothetical protein